MGENSRDQKQIDAIDLLFSNLIQIKKDGNNYIATDILTKISNEGATEKKACQNLKHALYEHFRALNEKSLEEKKDIKWANVTSDIPTERLDDLPTRTKQMHVKKSIVNEVLQNYGYHASKNFPTDKQYIHYHNFVLQKIVTVPNKDDFSQLFLESIQNQATILNHDLLSLTDFTPIQVKNTVVGFVDLLGFSQKMNELDQNEKELNEYLNEFNKILKEALDFVGCDHPSRFRRIPKRMNHIKVFSDSIHFINELVLNNSFDHPLDKIDLGDLLNNINLISQYQLMLAINGLFTRGAIVIGKTYSDHKITFGKPLVDAYKLESEIAEYPLIMLDTPVVDIINRNLFWKSSDTITDSILICSDTCSDSKWFINYLYDLKRYEDDINYTEDENGTYVMNQTHITFVINLLDKHKANIMQNLDKFKNTKIVTKYLWLAEYHNYFCKTYFEDVENLLISDIGS